MTEQRAIELIEGAEYGVLSMTDEEGMPYAIPVNHVWDGENTLYVHCAPERMKALHLLINKLSPEHKQLGEKYTQASFHRTEIIKIEVQEFSGKCKKVNKAG